MLEDTNVDAMDVDTPSASAPPVLATSTSSELATPTPGPHIPDDYLRAVILPLCTGECSNKTFRNLVAIIEHLSHLPGARDVFLSQLSASADEICEMVMGDMDALVAVLQSASGDEVAVQKVTLAKFTPADSTQAKFLRVLKTVDYMYTKKKTPSPSGTKDDKQQRGNRLAAPRRGDNWRQNQSPTPSDGSDVALNESKKAVQDENVVSQFNKAAFSELWRRLNFVLNHVQQHSNLLFVATVLLPLIECLMIVCKYAMLQKDGSRRQMTQSITLGAPSSENVAENVQFGEELFFSFTEKHRKTLNTLVRNNPKLLRGSFSLLVHNPKVLEFDNKRNYFNQQLHKKPPDQQRYGAITVNIRRQYIFQDSYYQLQNRGGAELKYGKLSVHFYEEEGADYGGVTREWYQELTKEMFNPNYVLFTPSAEKAGVTYQPNPSSSVNPSHLLYFKFVGRVIGKAIYDSKLLDCYFTRSFYKHILGKSVDVADMEAVDPEYHKSLVWILENSIDDVLDLTFSTEMEEFGQQKIVDLKPDGRNIAVTDENKHEYVRLISENRLTTAIREQITAFLAGFHDIIPRELIQIFNEKELELLISGVPDIDIDDWKNNTEYRGYTSTSAQVQWFWRAVRSFDQEERAKLLQFATGTSKVPLEGFSHLQGIGGKQKFQIQKDFGDISRLPSAHTCFNQIDLPVYESYEQLKERLYVSITEAATGFGFE